MIEVSEYIHAVNIEILKKWNIGDKVKFNQSGTEALGVIKGFTCPRGTNIALQVQDLYNSEELFLYPQFCGKI